MILHVLLHLALILLEKLGVGKVTINDSQDKEITVERGALKTNPDIRNAVTRITIGGDAVFKR